ncbi:MAG: hypothetical protein M0Z99_12985 [Betaproteobacteria bacterium]|nr:hypothetical protein [Betaproteobacteria bacterium]
MPSYLQGADLAAFGVPTATAAQITAASSLIDGYLSRREGLIWVPDANGSPAYMQGLQPTISLALGAAIAPGLAVQVTVTGPTSMIAPGSVLIADIATPAATEALVVQAIMGQVVTFVNVQFAHLQGAVLAAGLTIVEQRTMPQGRPITQISRTPIVNALSGVGRYGYQRRGDDGFGNMDTYNLLAVMSKFGGPPAWEPFNLQANSIDPQTGEIWVPAGVLLAYYTEVKIHYVAGWTYASLPSEIKQACAQLVTVMAQSPQMGNIRSYKAGDTAITMATASYFSDDTKTLLVPYHARKFM